MTTLLDGTGEVDETLLVDLSNPVGTTIGDGQGVGTIEDADPHATFADVQKAEGHAGKTSFL